MRDRSDQIAGTRAATRSPAFDGRFDQATDLVRMQRHRRESPPVDGQGRWPVSVLLMPSPTTPAAVTVAELTARAASLAGPAHWRTGTLTSAHLTVRALENYRELITAEDDAVVRYRAALDRAAAVYGPVSFTVRGMVLTSGTVMACALPLAGSPDGLLDRVTDELGGDAWRERSFGRRDLWYLNLLHFAGDVDDPAGLIEWVHHHRETTFGTVTVDQLSLVRFRFTRRPEPRMQPEILSRHRLTGTRPRD